MATPVGSILRAACRRPGDRLNILCVATHEAYGTSLSNVNADFYMFYAQGLKEWDTTTRPIPPNHRVIRALPDHLDFDLVLCQHQVQYPLCRQFADMLGIPLILLYHVLPNTPNPAKMRADRHAFITDYNRDAWGFSEGEALVIRHGIDLDTFCYSSYEPRHPHVLAVANKFKERNSELGFDWFCEAMDGLPARVVGDNPTIPLSSPACDLAALADEYRKASLFVNSASHSPVPLSMLEALASGCVVITRSNPFINSIILNGVNGFVTDNRAEAGEIARSVLATPEAQLAELRYNARATIFTLFGLDRFTAEWNGLFEAVLS